MVAFLQDNLWFYYSEVISSVGVCAVSQFCFILHNLYCLFDGTFGDRLFRVHENLCVEHPPKGQRPFSGQC